MTVRREFLERDGVRVVTAKSHGSGAFLVQVDDRIHEVTAERLPDGGLTFVMDGVRHLAATAPLQKNVQVRVDGQTWQLTPATGRQRAGGEAGGGLVEAPMSGTIQSVSVAVGDQVRKGQTLVVLTAMKMEHKLTAGIAGLVQEVKAVLGATVDQGQVLVRVESLPSTDS